MPPPRRRSRGRGRQRDATSVWWRWRWSCGASDGWTAVRWRTRDSKDPHGPALVFPVESWSAFTTFAARFEV
ncbi:DUF397 domain-containing protein [Kitasatospora sp. NPDC051853]|uniref:DUF397 domain-containing protein n=1 Tax=Kitasatospora sp. NPDC051853 TaxID=3364058 RepID=UPI0037B82527